MTISLSGVNIVCNNEAALTLALIRSALPAEMTVSGGKHYVTARNIVLQGTTSLLGPVDGESLTLTGGTLQFIEVDTTATWQVGRIDGNGDTYGGGLVQILLGLNSQLSNNTGMFLNRGAGACGTIKWYASKFVCTPGAAQQYIFMRAYNGSGQVAQIQDCQWDGMSGRFQGTTSFLKNIDITNDLPGSTNVPMSFTVLLPFGTIDTVSSRKSSTAFYSRVPGGSTTEIANLKARNMTDGIVNAQARDNTGDAITVLLDPDLGGAAMSCVWSTAAGATTMVYVDEAYSYLPTAKDSAGSGVTGVLLRITDASSAQVAAQTSGAGGVFTVEKLKRKRLSATTNTTGSATTTATLTPHAARYRKYGYLENNFVVNATAKSIVDIGMQVNPATVLSQAAAAALTGIAVNFGTSTITVSANRTVSQVYDYLQDQLAQTGNMQYNDPSSLVAGVLTLTGWTIVVTGAVVLTGSVVASTVTLSSGGDVSGYYVTGGTRWVPISFPNLISGTRIQIYNVTDAASVVNTTLSGAGYFTHLAWTTDKTYRYRATYASGATAKLGLTGTALFSNVGFTVLDAQVDDTVYNSNAITGSGVTEFAADYPNVEVDVNDPDGVTTAQRLYAWFIYNTTTSSGIANMFGGMTAEDVINYRINTAILNLKIQNVGSLAVILSGARLYRDDGTSIFVAGTNPIQSEPGKAYLAAAGADPFLIEQSPGLTRAASLADIYTKSGQIKTTTDATKTVVDATKVVVDGTSTLLTTTKGVVDSTKTVVDATKVLVDAAAIVNADTNADVNAVGSLLAATKAVVDGIAADDVFASLLENGLSVADALRIMLSAMAGKVSGAPLGPIVFRDTADTKDRIVATVDPTGNRTAVTLVGA